MVKTLKFLVLVVLSTAFSACASHPDDIATISASPILYKSFDCDQIALESYRVNARSGELYSSLKKTANTDAVQMGVGLVLLWPVLFGLEGGDGAEAAEYGRLKGEGDALNRASIDKKCEFPDAKQPS